MFWKKRVDKEPEKVALELEEPFSLAEEMKKAVRTDREYIDIQKESLSIDVIEMLHFFNELPSRLPSSLIKKNEGAIDYFRDFTGVYVGNVFEFYQTVVLFYYKNWHNPAFPFEGSQLEFAFSKVAQNLFVNLSMNLAEAHQKIVDMVVSNPKAFFLHEDYIDMLAHRFMKRTIALVPKLEFSPYYNPVESEFVTLGNEIYRDVLDALYDMEHQDFSEYDTIYQLLHQNDEFIDHPDHFNVRAMFYYPIQHVEIIRALQYVRLYRLQQALYQGLEYEASTQVDNLKTVKILETYLFSENERLYSQKKEVYQENKRFLTLFFDAYCFEHEIDDAKDSPKVRNCLKELLLKVKASIINEEFTGELEILVRKAYYEHKLLAGS
ncbi:MAG: hypothetical protein KBT36_16040 [Kurthia sp.]|nr:hypothetical protein [Candidatus Kurthia equi]